MEELTEYLNSNLHSSSSNYFENDYHREDNEDSSNEERSHNNQSELKTSVVHDGKDSFNELVADFQKGLSLPGIRHAEPFKAKFRFQKELEAGISKVVHSNGKRIESPGVDPDIETKSPQIEDSLDEVPVTYSKSLPFLADEVAYSGMYSDVYSSPLPSAYSGGSEVAGRLDTMNRIIAKELNYNFEQTQPFKSQPIDYSSSFVPSLPSSAKGTNRSESSYQNVAGVTGVVNDDVSGNSIAELDFKSNCPHCHCMCGLNSNKIEESKDKKFENRNESGTVLSCGDWLVKNVRNGGDAIFELENVKTGENKLNFHVFVLEAYYKYEGERRSNIPEDGGDMNDLQIKAVSVFLSCNNVNNKQTACTKKENHDDNHEKNKKQYQVELEQSFQHLRRLKRLLKEYETDLDMNGHCTLNDDDDDTSEALSNSYVGHAGLPQYLWAR